MAPDCRYLMSSLEYDPLKYTGKWRLLSHAFHNKFEGSEGNNKSNKCFETPKLFLLKSWYGLEIKILSKIVWPRTSSWLHEPKDRVSLV